MIKKSILIFLIFFSGAFNVYSMTNSEINTAIKEYFELNNVREKFSISKKIKLPNCKKDIKIKKKFNTFNTLEFICPLKNPWSYNIRIKIETKKNYSKKKRKKIYDSVKLIKLNKNLKKGHIISANDVFFEKTIRTGSNNYFSKMNKILGRKIKVSIRKGQILRERHIEKNWTIREGQKVIIENSKSNVQILIDGIALSSAMQGEYMKVLNKSTGNTIKAWVKNNKKVSVFR